MEQQILLGFTCIVMVFTIWNMYVVKKSKQVIHDLQEEIKAKNYVIELYRYRETSK